MQLLQTLFVYVRPLEADVDAQRTVWLLLLCVCVCLVCGLLKLSRSVLQLVPLLLLPGATVALGLRVGS